MNAKYTRLAVSVALALGVLQPAAAANDRDDEDSVYQWGRWAVISPAAGGPEYVARLTPDAVNNARPGEADEFDPDIEERSVDPEPPEPPEPPVEVAGFCQPGAPCGYASYSKMPEQAPSNEAEAGPAQVIDVSEADFTSDDPNGPVLARFSLSEGTITDPEVDGGENSAADPVTVTSFQVTDAVAPGFADVDSVVITGDFDNGDIQGTDSQASFDADLGAIVTDSKTSVLSGSNQETGQEYQFEGVDAGYWSHLAQQQLEFILGDGESPTVTVLEDSEGYFVHGTTATIEQMQAFSAGHAVANYRGFVLDYAAPMQLTFDFGDRSWDGSFSSANGFQGFEISGVVDGANFAARDGAGREVAGSFFNGGFNASGAVNDGARVGVFSADYNGTGR